MRLVKAAVVVALGLTLLVPTFNALNASYVKDVPPPPWLPTPPTPPDITPPTDFTPPPGMTPPTDYKGKIPPGSCPPPVVKVLVDDNETLSTNTRFEKDLTFKIPNGSIGFRGYINWTNWQAQRVFASVSGPAGFKAWSNQTDGNQPAGFLAPTTPISSTSWVYDSYRENNGQVPKTGEYTLRLTADFPIRGQIHSTLGVALACGGMLSS